MSAQKNWQDRASEARRHRDEGLARVQPALEGLPRALPKNSTGLAKALLTPREFELTEKYTATDLLYKLRTKELSSEAVTRAFLRRAALAQASTNCLTDLLWDEAIERARYLDSLPEPLGPLHGLPISTKEHHGSKSRNGTANASYIAWIGKPHGSNPLYDILWDAGCVFFARTTQPQTLMHLETNNNIFGRTVNPYNRDLTSGGSSGGEAALIGMRGSLLGVGGDIGGSVRCPAAHCGIYGFKPSTGRLPSGGQAAPMAGKDAILATVGPMATDRNSLEMMMRVVIDAKPWLTDPSLVVKEWSPHKFDRPLKIAILWWDGVVMPHPPITRALREVSDACKNVGMEVVDWDCEALDHQTAWEIISALYWPDGGEEVLGLLEQSGEPILPLTKFIIQEQQTVKKLDMAGLFQLCARRDEYRSRYARHWNKTGELDGREVDVILCPPSFGAATPHDQSRYWGYTSQWNLLDYPGAVFPVSTVDQEKDKRDDGYVPKNEQDQMCYELYSPERFKDAPISLQIVGRRYHEEKVIAALAEIERALGRD
ncbi:putative Amidase signature domain-containing protein [Seiridium cardinale]|uniref:amidase n=1 Tax=Seiridium cardinale TaxID=138064 RepID=A0ABR2XJP8_9PEZI